MHKSGKVLTAEHVVSGCATATLIFANSVQVSAKVTASDKTADIALLEPASPVPGTAFEISERSDFKVGAQVVTWGFPSGYISLVPMLSVGYLSGAQPMKTASGSFSNRYVVNAAFNSGNSGGPLIHVETSKVIGVVSSKLGRLSDDAMSALAALQSNQSGILYKATRKDGTTFDVSEGQVAGIILGELQKQVQLVIGMATTTEDLRALLTKNGITP